MNKIICFLLVVISSLKMQNEVYAGMYNSENLQQNDAYMSALTSNDYCVCLEMSLYLKNQQISKFIHKYYDRNKNYWRNNSIKIYKKRCTEEYNQAKIELLKLLYGFYATFGFCDEFKQILGIVNDKILFDELHFTEFLNWLFPGTYDPIEWVSDVDKKYEFVREMFFKDLEYKLSQISWTDLSDILMYHCILSSINLYKGEISIFKGLVSSCFLQKNGNRSEDFYDNLLNFFVSTEKLTSISEIWNWTLVKKPNSKSLKWLDKNLRVLCDIDGEVFDKIKNFQEFLRELVQIFAGKLVVSLCSNDVYLLLKRYGYIDDENNITDKFNLDFLSFLYSYKCNDDEKKKYFKEAYEFRYNLQKLCKGNRDFSYSVYDFCTYLYKNLVDSPNIVPYYDNTEKLLRMKKYVNIHKDSPSIDKNTFYDNIVYMIANIPNNDTSLKINFVRFLVVTFDMDTCDILNNKLSVLLENNWNKKDSRETIGVNNTYYDEISGTSLQYRKQGENTDAFYKIMFNGMGEQNIDFSAFIKDKLLIDLQNRNEKCDEFCKFLKTYLRVQESWFYRGRGGRKERIIYLSDFCDLFASCPGRFISLLLNYLRNEKYNSVGNISESKISVALDVRYENADCLNKLVIDFAEKNRGCVLSYDDDYILKNERYYVKNRGEDLDILEKGSFYYYYYVDPADCVIDDSQFAQEGTFTSIYRHCRSAVTNALSYMTPSSYR